MRAKIKSIHSPDVELIAVPPGETHFHYSIELEIGDEAEEGADLFQVVVCSPSWLSDLADRHGVAWGAYHLIMSEYSYEKMAAALTARVESCAGENWGELVQKIARFARWEFENYKSA